MHEVALAEGVLRIVMDAARASAAARVHTVWVELGALAHVEPDALAFCFDAVTRGSVAEGARLDIAPAAPVTAFVPDGDAGTAPPTGGGSSFASGLFGVVAIICVRYV